MPRVSLITLRNICELGFVQLIVFPHHGLEADKLIVILKFCCQLSHESGPQES